MDFVNICRKALYFRGSLSICPAYAGMILYYVKTETIEMYLSRVCGDDPTEKTGQKGVESFVPRMRG